MGKILGLDVSTKTIGIALFDDDGKLWELTHITPIIKPKLDNKLEEQFRKVDSFERLLTRYIELDIDRVIIEEPLLNSLVDSESSPASFSSLSSLLAATRTSAPFEARSFA